MAEAKRTTENKTSTAVKRVKVTIPIDFYDNSALPVSVNGERYLIKRGEEVEVPEYIADVLNNYIKVRSENMKALLSTNNGGV